MTPPRRDPLEAARRSLDEAAGALDGLRRLTGAGEAPGAPLVPTVENVRRKALEEARDDLRRMSEELEAVSSQGSELQEEVGRLREELAARPTVREVEDARAAGHSDSVRRAAELALQVVGLKERVTLLSAEHVRLESLRRRAEAAVADSETSRRLMEDTLRRDLLAANAALDRAAADSGVRDAKALSDIEALRKRLDQALDRLQRDVREGMIRKQKSEEDVSAKGDLEAAQAVIASLRREMAQQRADAAGRESALERRTHELEQRLSQALSPRDAALFEELERLRVEMAARPTAPELAEARAEVAKLRMDLRIARVTSDRTTAESGARAAKTAAEIEELRKRLEREGAARRQASADASSLKNEITAVQGVIASLRLELSEQRAGALGREQALVQMAVEREHQAAQGIIASLRKELSEQRTEATSRERELERRARELERPSIEAPADTEVEYGEGAGLEYPATEYALEPGWARLLHLVKPPLQAAYGHLRRLSAGPMSAGQRAILRLTGSSLSQASDSLATIELALADSPATTETAPVLPVIESALAAWDAVFRTRGIALTREISVNATDTPHDPEQLRLALHHILRNAVEALPRGSTLRVKLRASGSDAVRLEFLDNGPGYPPAWLERRFEPFVAPRRGHAGLGLAAVRRALRRWGGDAEASNAADGRGASLILTFAAALARPTLKG